MRKGSERDTGQAIQTCISVTMTLRVSFSMLINMLMHLVLAEQICYTCCWWCRTSTESCYYQEMHRHTCSIVLVVWWEWPLVVRRIGCPGWDHASTNALPPLLLFNTGSFFLHTTTQSLLGLCNFFIIIIKRKPVEWFGACCAYVVKSKEITHGWAALWLYFVKYSQHPSIHYDLDQ